MIHTLTAAAVVLHLGESLLYHSVLESLRAFPAADTAITTVRFHESFLQASKQPWLAGPGILFHSFLVPGTLTILFVQAYRRRTLNSIIGATLWLGMVAWATTKVPLLEDFHNLSNQEVTDSLHWLWQHSLIQSAVELASVVFVLRDYFSILKKR
jgi:hypothetical protein